MKKLIIASIFVITSSQVFADDQNKKLSCKYQIDEYAKNAEEWLPLENITVPVREDGGRVPTKTFSLEKGFSLQLSGIFVTAPGVSSWNKNRSMLFLTAQLIKQSESGKPTVVSGQLATSDGYRTSQRFNELRDGAMDVITYHHLQNTEYLTDVLQEKEIAKDAVVNVDVLCELKN